MDDKRLNCVLVGLKRYELTLREKQEDNYFVLPFFPKSKSMVSYAPIESKKYN